MSIYTYSQQHLLDKITFRRNEKGALRAYLHARAGTTADQLCDVMDKLKADYMECIPHTLDGAPTLEVRGFRGREGDLLAKFIKHGWIDGNPTIEKEGEEALGWKDVFKDRAFNFKNLVQVVRNNSLFYSGAAMTVADLGFTTYGIIHRRWEDMSAGLAYLTGSTLLGAYGSSDQSDFQIRDIAKLALADAKARGIEVSDDSALARAGGQRKEGFFRKLDNLLQKYPSEVANISYFIAGLMITRGALKHRVLEPQRVTETLKEFNDRKLAGLGDVALGSTTMTAASIATLVKEKKRDPDEPKREGIQGVIDWVRESPLRLAGWMYIASTACHTFTTFKDTRQALRISKDMSQTAIERKLAKDSLKAIPFRIVFISATILGELLLSISSKGHGEGVVSDKSVDISMIAIAADLIVKQKPEMQEQLIEYMAGFLQRPDVLAMKQEEVTKLLKEEVEALRKNPWARPYHAAQAKAAEASPALKSPELEKKPSGLTASKDILATLPSWSERSKPAPAEACSRQAG